MTAKGKECSQRGNELGKGVVVTESEKSCLQSLPLNPVDQDGLQQNQDQGTDASCAEHSEQGSRDDDDDEDYPEGGLQAWLVVFGSFCGLMVAFGMLNAIGIYQTYLATHQLADYSESAIGWISGIFVFISFAAGIQIGPVFDTYGPRWLVLSGTICTTASFLLVGVCTQYWHFVLAFSLLGGLGSSLISTPSFAAIGHFFHAGRGNATGIAAAGGSFGGVVFTLALQSLFPLVGFAWTTRIQGLIALALLLVLNLLIRTRLPPKPGQSVLIDRRIFRNPSFILVTVASYFLEWGLFSPLAYLTSFGLSTHGAIPSAFAYQLLAIFNAASCFGRWLPGLLADRIGRFNTMCLAVTMCILAALCLWLPAAMIAESASSAATTSAMPGLSSQSSMSIYGLTVAFAVIMGFVSGSNISLAPVCIGMLCDTQDYARYYATSYFVASFASLTGIPLAGALIPACGGAYWGVALFTGASYAVALVGFATVRVMKVGWRLTAIY